MRREPADPMELLILSLDRALHTVVPGAVHSSRPNPAGPVSGDPDDDIRDEDTRAHVAGLMRVNHSGEVCAQALYQGQALTASDPETREAMAHAAAEEVDHLAWCEARLEELDARPSLLNPIWYAGSFGIGAIAGLIGDRWSLGFLAETERQVVDHLQSHLDRLPEEDGRTRRIVEQMQEDEERHGDGATAAGGAELPPPVKSLMSSVARVMTTIAFRV
jgi:ubiquinone biosynthesis monooxygenase Coq7